MSEVALKQMLHCEPPRRATAAVGRTDMPPSRGHDSSTPNSGPKIHDVFAHPALATPASAGRPIPVSLRFADPIGSNRGRHTAGIPGLASRDASERAPYPYTVGTGDCRMRHMRAGGGL
jgi:hypothetical protein